MEWIGILCLCAPIACMIALVLTAFLQGVFCKAPGTSNTANPIRHRGATYALGAAFLCFSVFYRPRLELAAIAQREQQEQPEDDHTGDPESPIRHLLRQLRRIRHGDPVDRLVWRLE